MRRIILFLLLSLAFLSLLTLYHLWQFSDKNFHLIFCNVGQGDGILIRTPRGHEVIVDGGPEDNSMTECLARHLPFWDHSIDVMFLTHPDADHLTGLIEVAKTYSIDHFGTSDAPKDTQVYQELMSTLKERNIKVDYVTRGDRVITDDGLTMIVEWPTKAFISAGSKETNDYSVTHLVKMGNITALLDGDLPSVYLNSIMPIVANEIQTMSHNSPEVANKNSNFIGHLNIFKPPHHGSKTGVDEFTFQHNKPDIAVISAGAHNKYGHPAPQVLKILNDTGIPYKETKYGDVEFVSDGVKWWVKN